MTLPISRMVIYKHGVGYFERRGPLDGENLRLTFAREAMDDVLKSLVVLDLGAGQVLNIDFETPEDRAALLAKGSIHLSEHQSLLDLLRDLRGRQVRLQLKDASERSIAGLIVGVDYEPNEALRRAIVSIYQNESRQVRSFALDALSGVELLDDAAAADLGYFLRAAQSEEDRRSAVVHLSPGEHDLLVGYIAPAPAWRVSYRLLYEEATATPESGNTAQDICLLQGWGVFDNQLDEDIEQVELTLVAGMPISFRYRLYEPKTPIRPMVEDEERTVNAPIAFDAVAAPPPAAAPMMAMGAAAPAPSPKMARSRAAASFAAQEMEEAVQVSAIGDERGALFAYNVAHPVSVARGQSAMVPIVSNRLPARRELLYNSAKLPKHPVASLRLKNETGLTLERGPVTVLEAGSYAGEAVLPFTRSNGELIVPYAVELGITVEEQNRQEHQLHAVSIRGEYALYDEYDLRTRIYSITSSLDKVADVTIEHNRYSQYELFNTSPPSEETAGLARWKVGCAPHARTDFSVTERRLVRRQETVRSLTGKRLQELLSTGFINPATAKLLEEVLDLYRQIDQAQGQLKQIDTARNAIYKQQTQIQGNLQPLGRDGEEGSLRQRYVASLNKLENDLTALASEEEALRMKIASIEVDIQNRLRRAA